MRAIATITIMLALAGPALAQARPDTRTMTCQVVQLVVKRSGGVVMSTGTHTYARFVSDRSKCSLEEVTQRATVPTRDNPKCPLRICVSRNPAGGR